MSMDPHGAREHAAKNNKLSQRRQLIREELNALHKLEQTFEVEQQISALQSEHRKITRALGEKTFAELTK